MLIGTKLIIYFSTVPHVSHYHITGIHIGEYGKGVIYQTCSVNVDIFTCINFRGFMKMGNFA